MWKRLSYFAYQVHFFTLYEQNVKEDEEKSVKENKKGRGAKWKATTSYNNVHFFSCLILNMSSNKEL